MESTFEKLLGRITAAEEASLSYWGNALAGEVGEICNILKKLERDKDYLENDEYKFMMKRLGLEIGDVFIYLVLLCIRTGINLKSVTEFKLDMLDTQKFIQEHADVSNGISLDQIQDALIFEPRHLSNVLNQLVYDNKIRRGHFGLYDSLAYAPTKKRDFGRGLR